MNLDRGSVVLVDLGPTVGHEQQGLRPAVVVSDPSVVTDQKFPLIAVIPVTGTSRAGALYPPLAAGPSGLRKPCHALTDQLRSIDKRRIRTVYGQVSSQELASLERGLRLYLSLP